MGGLVGGPKIKKLPPPDPKIAQEKKKQREQKVSISSERFIERQIGLGPILLQAPTLNTRGRRR